MLSVHHLGISQSERIVWLCEELQIPYELKIYARDPVTRLAPAEYKALYPLGTAPVISDGHLVLAESGAIIEYIIAKYGNGRLALPPSHPNFADYLFWFHFANGSLMPSLMTELIAMMLDSAGENPMLSALRSRVDKGYDLIEQRLGKVDYIAGNEFTAADINLLFPLTTMRYFAPKNLSDFPNILAYLKRIGDRPAYQSAMAKGDPGMAPLLT